MQPQAWNGTTSLWFIVAIRFFMLPTKFNSFASQQYNTNRKLSVFQQVVLFNLLKITSLTSIVNKQQFWINL